MNNFYTVSSEQLKNNDKKMIMKINDEEKIFTIDTRFSTYEKILAALEAGQIKKSIELAIGAKAVKEIDKMDLTFEGYMNIVKTIQAAITGVAPEKVEEFFRNN